MTSPRLTTESLVAITFHRKGVVMQHKDIAKKVLMLLVFIHTVEAMIAYRAAKKRGKNPKLNFLLTQFFGVFVLVPLLRKPTEEQ